MSIILKTCNVPSKQAKIFQNPVKKTMCTFNKNFFNKHSKYIYSLLLSSNTLKNAGALEFIGEKINFDLNFALCELYMPKIAIKLF